MRDVNVWSGQQKPITADPYEYDLFLHHAIFSSVLSPLVTNYSRGRISGLLVDSWISDENFKRWTFKVKDGLIFGDGTPITSELIARSLTRIAYLQKNNRSESGLLEYLVGFEEIESPTSKIPGLVSSADTLTFKFYKPIPKLLEKLAFGMYAISHPSNYDQKTGLWKDPKSVVSSGPYFVDNWSEDSLTLSLREGIEGSYSLHPGAFERIVFKFSVTPENLDDTDIILGSSLRVIPDKSFQFFGPVGANIAYIKLYNYEGEKSPFYDSEVREVLRESFCRHLTAQGIEVKRSFFPLLMDGIKEAPELVGVNLDRVREKIEKSARTFRTIKFPEKPNKPGRIDLSRAYNESIVNFSIEWGLKVEWVDLDEISEFRPSDPDLNLHIDIGLLGTGILIDSPLEDIKFMFLSKEGIRLPDTDGSIVSLLQSGDFDAQSINRKIWEQSVIWPGFHYSNGVWTRPEIIDMSQLNLSIPPISFQWIGSK